MRASVSMTGRVDYRRCCTSQLVQPPTREHPLTRAVEARRGERGTHAKEHASTRHAHGEHAQFRNARAKNAASAAAGRSVARLLACSLAPQHPDSNVRKPRANRVEAEEISLEEWRVFRIQFRALARRERKKEGRRKEGKGSPRGSRNSVVTVSEKRGVGGRP